MANEKRLIDANALIDWLTKPTGFIRNCDDCPDIDCVHCVIEDAIKTAPTVDAVEVVHGRWNKKKDEKFIGYDADGKIKYRTVYSYYCGRCALGSAVKSAYCPNCGAKMDGDGNA